jgi:hypothetical protein
MESRSDIQVRYDPCNHAVQAEYAEYAEILHWNTTTLMKLIIPMAFLAIDDPPFAPRWVLSNVCVLLDAGLVTRENAFHGNNILAEIVV